MRCSAGAADHVLSPRRALVGLAGAEGRATDGEPSKVLAADGEKNACWPERVESAGVRKPLSAAFDCMRAHPAKRWRCA